ncbi:MAG: hypothetical protein ACI9W4_003029 [Rhodothermales bacterium]|jgi:hypothetical protein
MITVFCIRPVGYNIGNDAIYLGLQELLTEAFGQVVNVITLPATAKYDARGRAGLSASVIHEINQYGHGVIVGGGNLLENGELDFNADALESLEVPLMLFSLSRGRIYNRAGILTSRTDAMPPSRIRALNSAADYTLVRDNATQSDLVSMGCTDVVVGGCPTVFLDSMASRLPRLPTRDKDSVLFSIRHPHLMNIPLQKQAEVHQDVVALIEVLSESTGRPVRLLCHDYRDIPFAASIPGAEYIYTDDIYTYLALLNEAHLSVSYRLHATLPALTMGTPSIKISYDERALSLMDTLGLGEWNINLMETPSVVDAVQDRLGRLDELAGIVQDARLIWAEYRAICRSSFSAFAAEVRTSYTGTSATV